MFGIYPQEVVLDKNSLLRAYERKRVIAVGCAGGLRVKF